MVMFQYNQKEVYIDGYLQSNLDVLKQMVAKGWDGVGYVFGFEGDGKSTLASQICCYLDTTFSLDRTAFTSKQFLDYCLNAKSEQAILFDESYLTFSNKSLFDEMSKIIISMLTMIRKKRLYIIILSPTLFDIQRYLILHRSRFAIRVYANGLERGFFEFYNRERKYELYIKGKKEHNLHVVKANFRGRFTSFFPFDKDEYETKKDIALNELRDKRQSEKESLSIEHINKLKIDSQSEIVSWLNANQLLKRGAIKMLQQYYQLRSQSSMRQRLNRVTTDALLTQSDAGAAGYTT